MIFTTNFESPQNYYFAATYGLITVWGGIWGLIASKRWGGISSIMGKAVIVLSLGLLAQEFGQLVFSYYNLFLSVEIPYPSIADIGFFGSVLLYIYGIYLLSRASGIKFHLRAKFNQILAIFIPAVALIFSYILFLKGYQFDFSNLLKIILDFGYPLGEAVYISIAILIYILARKQLGGFMRSRILFIIAAFIAQYVAEFNFLFQNSRGTWVNGGYGDYLYFISYLIMTLGLIGLNSVFANIEQE